MKTNLLIFFLTIFLISCTPSVGSESGSAPTKFVDFSPTLFSPTLCKSISGKGLPTSNLANTHIIYRGEDGNDGIKLWVISIDSGEQHMLNNYPQISGDLRFLQDGQHFLATDYDNIWLGNIDGSSPIKIEKVGINDKLLSNFQSYSPIWTDILKIGDPSPPIDLFDYYNGRYHSPDNKKIASWKRGDNEFVIIDQATQNQTQIIRIGNQDEINGIWTLDSKWFVFTYTYGTPEDYFSQLLKVSSDALELHPLTPKFEHTSLGNPVISPDGEKVAFRISQGVSQSFEILWLDQPKSNIYEFSAYSSGYTFLFGNSIVWSPDSQWFAFVVEKGTNEEIHIINIANAETYCVISGPHFKDILMDWR